MTITMKWIARSFAIATLALIATEVPAQAWPSRQVRMIVNVGPGVGPDVVMRFVAERLSTKLGRPFMVDNVVGGGGVTPSNAMAQAAPDGHTFLLGGVGIVATDRFLFKSLPYDPDRDFAPVGVLYDSTPFGLAVNVDLPVHTVADLIVLAKAQPGKLSYGSEQAGVQAIPGQWFTIRAGIDMVGVPYKTPAQMIPDLMGGRVQAIFGSYQQLVPFHASGKMRLIAITREKRLPGRSDLPAIAETIPGFRVAGIGIVFAPSRTPQEIIAKLNGELDIIVKDPEYQKRMDSYGYTTLGTAGSTAEIAQFIKSEKENWTNVFRSVKIEPQ